MFLVLTCPTLASNIAGNFTTSLRVGLPLMIVGMGVVLIALTIIGEMMRWTSILCDKWMPATQEQAQESIAASSAAQSTVFAEAQSVPSSTTNEPKIGETTLAVITAATVYTLKQNLRIKRITPISSPMETTGTRWATIGRLMHQDSHNLRR